MKISSLEIKIIFLKKNKREIKLWKKYFKKGILKIEINIMN